MYFGSHGISADLWSKSSPPQQTKTYFLLKMAFESQYVHLALSGIIKLLQDQEN